MITLIVLIHQLSFAVFSEAVQPENFFLSNRTALIKPVNGSSAIGHCSNVTIGIGDGESTYKCRAPTSSVLFDGNIPTFPGLSLDGDMWASQLLTVQLTASQIKVAINFDFTDTPGYTGVDGVEVVLFNCPPWGIRVAGIGMLGSESTSMVGTTVANTVVDKTSCSSVVNVSLQVTTTLPVLTLECTLLPGSVWVHFAEVRFFVNNAAITPAIMSGTTLTIIMSDTTPAITSDTTPANTSDTTPANTSDTTPANTSDTTPAITSDTTPAIMSDITEAITSDTTPAITSDTTPANMSGATKTIAFDATSVGITARDTSTNNIDDKAFSIIIILASFCCVASLTACLLAAVLTCYCVKHNKRGTSHHSSVVVGLDCEVDGQVGCVAETGTSAGREGQEYEEVDGSEGGVVVSDPTYVEVGEGGNTFQLKENEAYATGFQLKVNEAYNYSQY